MTILNEEFLIFPEEVHRMGNSNSHRLTKIKVGEVDTYIINGVTMIRANGKGVSLYTLEKVLEKGLTGFAWRFKKNTQVVANLKLVNDEPGHYMLCPIKNMPLDEYKGLLENMGVSSAKYIKVKEGGKIQLV
ncbi:MAG: hypothetical protein OEZ39_08075 [Gammaproteobacteria bacterium]|nr:hypothetical protein [Gammaproteobacteria bacterium]MDH5651818.1 hypothetical protein [Gammaproteobacteria bacterium]